MSPRLDPAINPKRGTVYLYSRAAQMDNKVKACLRRDTLLLVKDSGHQSPDAQMDYYIVSSLSAAVEREAARRGAIPVVLPAATVWLAAKIDEITASGGNVAIMMRRLAA